MKKEGDALFVDTNVLLDATNSLRTHYPKARALLEGHEELVFSAQIVREYFVVVTRPVEVNGFGMQLSDAMDNMAEIRRVVRLLPEEKPVLSTFLNLIRVIPVQGKAIHDAWIVAAMLVHGVSRLVTSNLADFARFEDRVRAQTAAQTVA